MNTLYIAVAVVICVYLLTDKGIHITVNYNKKEDVPPALEVVNPGLDGEDNDEAGDGLVEILNKFMNGEG